MPKACALAFDFPSGQIKKDNLEIELLINA